VREDNKLDITLELFGYRKVEPGTEKILSQLKANKGFLPYGDKTPPDIITREFQMSKKVFKKAIGALYRQRVIDISEEGIKKL
jgi:predicted RNA-binding protein (virulence factor B family)